MPSQTPEEFASWTHYWADGNLTSLPGDFPTRYDGEIADFWAAQCRRLRDGARVLDACTGNGAVALLIADAARAAGQSLQITAVDAAAIEPEVIRRRFPQAAATLQSIEFLGSRRFEWLELPDASFDLITSQYGLEYCPLEDAARRARDLLVPGGRLAMICHAMSSDMLRTMTAEHAQYRRLERLGLVDALSAIQAGRISWPAFRKVLKRVRAALGRGRSAIPQLDQYVLSLVSPALKMEEADFHRYDQATQAFVRQLVDGRSRLEQMLRVHHMMREDPDWIRAFTDAGLRLEERGELHYRGRHRAGETFVLVR